MKRKKRDTRKDILEAGLKVWLDDPNNVSASSVGRLCGISHAAVLYHFPYGVRDSVAEYAVEKGDQRIMAQLIVTGHKAVESLSPSERAKCLAGV